MQIPIIKCYTSSTANYPFCFYILNKGDNSGKPLLKPCPNCFIVICQSHEEVNFFWTICYGLYESRIFRQDLIGSCIQFIRITCFKKRFFKAIHTVSGREDQLQQLVVAFMNFQALRTKLLVSCKSSESLIRSHIINLIK